MLENIENLKGITQNQFNTLYELSKQLNQNNLKDELIENSLNLIIEAVAAERGLFAKYDEYNGEFSVIASKSLNTGAKVELSEFSSGILQQVISKSVPCLYHDVQNHPQTSQFISLKIQNIKSIIGIPVKFQSKIWGVILVDSSGNRKAFTHENLEYLDFFSNLISLALDKIFKIEELTDENRILKSNFRKEIKLPEIIGESDAIKKLLSAVYKVAATNATVLILGESGTGKDLIANAIHKLSNRANFPYLAQFCGSIPDTLLESELFGYKKGAFSGASSDKKGLFEIADKGTFFLDEIADISQALQAKLLRVIQNKEIIRLGDTQTKKIDVRIITATNKDLRELISKGQFREDLYYRLNVAVINIPPLRERKEDIPLLVEHFIKKYSPGNSVLLSEAAIKKLTALNWEGNVRQLENVIHRALIFSDSGVLTPEHLDPDELPFSGNEKNTPPSNGSLDSIVREILIKRLKEHDFNKTATAKSLGVSVRWIQLTLKKIEEEGVPGFEFN